MTKTVELEVAHATLSELIDALGPDEVVLIVRNQKTVARIVPIVPTPQFGGCKELLTIVAEDDDPLKDFEDYMP